MYLDHSCDSCGNKFPDDEFERLPEDGKNYCLSCFAKLTEEQHCEMCKRKFRETELTFIEGNKLLCNDCFPKRYPNGMCYQI